MKKDLLKEYNRKRDFKKTKEPSGKLKSNKKKSKLSFVIQEHHARNLHYDFRLEWDGVLKSWAVPKGPSEDPKEKRLAVQTEDHPLSYGKFHGTIPQGEYGAGEVYIWDKGTWEPEGDVDKGFKKGHLIFSLKGSKLSGRWHLVKTKWGGRQDNWLLMKSADEDKLPDFIPPQLPRLTDSVPTDDEWIYELKLDGYRIQTHLQNSNCRLYTRNQLDWSENFPHIRDALSKMKIKNAIFDGEIVAIDDDGHTDFQKLQNSFKEKLDTDLRYYVFDILYLNDQDLRGQTLIERKKILKNLIKKNKYIYFNDHLDENGEEFYKLCCKNHLEGVISKRANSTYQSGRNDLWIKTKCTARQEFVIGGYTEGKEGRIGLGALLLGVYENEKLKYVGKVGTGFNSETLRFLKKMLGHISQKASPFDLKSPRVRGINWVKPIKVAEVSFTQWTRDGHLRNPVFMGLREDKDPVDILKEKPKGKMRDISSPEKILFKKEKITKKEVSEYYQKMAKHILPHIENRPLSLMRCPEGSEKTCFYQKHLPDREPYITLDSPEGLQELIQLNAFEIHAWNSRSDHVLNPDQIVMDFDPGPGVKWSSVIEAAFELKEMLSDLDLECFVKLTGGKGLHVHIPVAPIYDWEQIKSFAQTLAMQMEMMNPKKYTSSISKNLRRGKIFIDYLRNGYGATAVIPYSLRAKPLSTVALPISWTELKKIKSPEAYTLRSALKKVKSRKVDPWKKMFNLKQKISILAPSEKSA